jgi:hypothetical protein
MPRRVSLTFSASSTLMIPNATTATPPATLFVGFRRIHSPTFTNRLGGFARIGSFFRYRRRSAASSAIVA